MRADVHRIKYFALVSASQSERYRKTKGEKKRREQWGVECTRSEKKLNEGGPRLQE